MPFQRLFLVVWRIGQTWKMYWFDHLQRLHMNLRAHSRTNNWVIRCGARFGLSLVDLRAKQMSDSHGGTLELNRQGRSNKWWSMKTWSNAKARVDPCRIKQVRTGHIPPSGYWAISVRRIAYNGRIVGDGDVVRRVEVWTHAGLSRTFAVQKLKGVYLGRHCWKAMILQGAESIRSEHN